MDRRTLGEARRLFAISANVAGRLAQYNGLQATTLYPPSHLAALLHSGPYGDYILSPARLDAAKRIDLLLAALAHSATGLRAVITGSGPERARLAARARQLGLAARVEFTGFVSDERLAELYAGCRAVFYAPVDEDYGFATVEAFGAARPVLTTTDAGGVLEFVRDGVSGLVTAPTATALGQALDALTPALAAQLGAANPARVADLTWQRVVDALLAEES